MKFWDAFVRWFHRMGSPKYFFDHSKQWIFWSRLGFCVLFPLAMIWGLFIAPSDYQQGDSFRIIYIHVPSASLAMSIYAMVAGASLIGLVWRMKLSFMAAKACLLTGAVFTFLALATGAIWGKPTWGTWWSWDARLTSMLILLFLYMGLMLMHAVIPERDRADRATAILSLVGIINLPIIKYSVVWWNSLHQPATFTLTKKPAMPPEMWLPLLVAIIAFYCFFIWVFFLNLRKEILQREQKTTWVHGEIIKPVDSI